MAGVAITMVDIKREGAATRTTVTDKISTTTGEAGGEEGIEGVGVEGVRITRVRTMVGTDDRDRTAESRSGKHRQVITIAITVQLQSDLDREFMSIFCGTL